MADTIVIGRAFAPGVVSVSKSTTELTSLQTNTTASTLTPGTVLSGLIKMPGVVSVSKSTTELTSLQTNTTASTLTPGTKVLGVMIRPSVLSVQRLSTFVLASAEETVIRSGPVNSQRWTMG